MHRLGGWVAVFPCVCAIAFGRYEWEPEKRVAIRPNTESCSTFLVPADQKGNSTVGVQLAGNSPQEVEAQLQQILKEQGPQALRGGRAFITGIGIAKQDRARVEFEQLLEKYGLADVPVTVLSVPSRDVKHLALEALRGIRDRAAHFLPSFARHYETPLKSEVVAGISSDVLVEIPNVLFLYSTLPQLDAHSAVVTHTAVLLAYNVYMKSMLNWLLEPGFNRVEAFLKSALLSFPFVLNYSVFGNLSKITAFYQANGWAATAAQFPSELASFGTTQGLTLFLQVVFYRTVITNRIGAWQNNQTGTENAIDARTVTSILRTPILALDAITLAMAGGNATPLFSMGPFDFNTGHAALATLTAVGAVALKPQLLDPSLDWYRWVKNLLIGCARALKLRS